MTKSIAKTWVVIPVSSAETDLSQIVANLTGSFVVPETYTIPSPMGNDIPDDTVPHPHFGQSAPNFSGRILFVHFGLSLSPNAGASSINLDGNYNIAKAWNTGINNAVGEGAEAVVILNGPIVFDPFVIADGVGVMADGMSVVNIADGAMWVLDALSAIRADETFAIWFADNDIYRQAGSSVGTYRSPYATLVELENARDLPNFETIVKAEQTAYEAKYA